MTHDTPDGTHERRVWCDTCQLSVVPSGGGENPTCPGCGNEL